MFRYLTLRVPMFPPLFCLPARSMLYEMKLSSRAVAGSHVSFLELNTQVCLFENVGWCYKFGHEGYCRVAKQMGMS